MPAFVLDACIALNWCVPDEASPYDQAAMTQCLRESAAVPLVWPLEVANGLVMLHRRGKISLVRFQTALSAVGALPVELHGAAQPRLEPRLVDLALTQQLTIYDATYLDLAQRLGVPLATADKALLRAAAAVGVAVFEPANA